MIIGTVRPEEARVSDAFEGYHEFHTEETQQSHGSFEIFWSDLDGMEGDHLGARPDRS